MWPHGSYIGLWLSIWNSSRVGAGPPLHHPEPGCLTLRAFRRVSTSGLDTRFTRHIQTPASHEVGQPPATNLGFSGARVRKRCFSLKRSTIVFIELGMLAGILVTGYTLPGSTPLRVFLIASGACFVVGNILLARKIKQIKAGESPAKKDRGSTFFELSRYWRFFGC